MDIGGLIGTILVVGCVIYFCLYYIIKKATKDALEEYFKEKEDKFVK